MSVRGSAADAARTMKRMEALAREGKKEAIEYLAYVKGKVDTLSEETVAFLEETEGIARTVIANVDPLVQHITTIIGLPASACTRISTIVGAMEPRRKQGRDLKEAIKRCRQAMKNAVRTLIDQVEAIAEPSFDRLIETLPEDE